MKPMNSQVTAASLITQLEPLLPKRMLMGQDAYECRGAIVVEEASGEQGVINVYRLDGAWLGWTLDGKAQSAANPDNRGFVEHVVSGYLDAKSRAIVAACKRVDTRGRS